MSRSTLATIAFSIALAVASAQAQATHHVRSAKQLSSLIESKRLRPGDTVLWKNGDYTDQRIDLDGCDGTESAQIELRAERPGGVVLRGKSRLRIGTKWWTIRGLHFDGSDGSKNSPSVVQFRSNAGRHAEHTRLTNCALTNLRTKGSSKWVQIYGRHNRIDHCRFAGKDSKGALITVELADLAVGDEARHTIEWNYFGDVAPQAGNDNETIRVGSSKEQSKHARCLVRHNLFERCDGENEIISNKSSYNTYRANTFRRCNGALVLRHGHHARVEHNHFFADGARDAGGIRIIDSHHVVAHNHLEGLTGMTWNAALSFLGGKQSSGGSSNGYQAVDEVLVANNAIVGCKRSVFFNDAKGKRAPRGTIANNRISSQHGPLVLDRIGVQSLNWIANDFSGAAIGIETPKIRDDARFGAGKAVGPAPDASARPLTQADVGTTFTTAGAQPRTPASVLDLTNWKLTLPFAAKGDSNARELRGAELAQFVDRRCFFTEPATPAIVFRAHCGGSTTRGSKYPRCELRELRDRGRKASWSTTDDIRRTMTMRVAITKTPKKKKHVVCAQIHDADDDVLMIRLEGKKLFVGRKPENDIVLDRRYRLGAWFDLKIEAFRGNIRIWYDGKLAMDWLVARTGCYFKAGCYTQSNKKKGDKARAYGEVRIARLQVEHRRD